MSQNHHNKPKRLKRRIQLTQNELKQAKTPQKEKQTYSKRVKRAKMTQNATKLFYAAWTNFRR